MCRRPTTGTRCCGTTRRLEEALRHPSRRREFDEQLEQAMGPDDDVQKLVRSSSFPDAGCLVGKLQEVGRRFFARVLDAAGAALRGGEVGLWQGGDGLGDFGPPDGRQKLAGGVRDGVPGAG